MKSIVLLVTACTIGLLAKSQNTLTAHDIVPDYQQATYFGTNLGWYNSAWTDDKLADIAAGNPALDIEGVGVRNLRLSLPEDHLEKWGYAIERSDVDHYRSLGMRELTAFLQDPSEEHRLVSPFCPDDPYPQLFQNMYLPIWDDGENGTPVNDQNYYALYVYRTVQEYQDDVRFWEIMNEPDFTDSPAAIHPSGEPGSWYDVAPEPCDLKRIKAPIYYYIRFLRIAYEVIKSIDPEAYVAVGGLGYPSFLDAVLRYTDEPNNGSLNADFPDTGGAYFDALSYHSYPANDGSMRYYDFDAHAFVYSRHSDAAAAGVVRLKNDFEAVLEQRGYGSTHPSKRCIVTETNVSRRIFNNQMGSIEGQRNFTIKAMVKALQNGIDQFYTFALGDIRTDATASNAWQLMGFYYALAPIQPYQQQVTPNGIAFHTAADFLHEYNDYDATYTNSLQLPTSVDGGAFRNATGEVAFILWAKTTVDESEVANATYIFPAPLAIENFSRRAWNYSQNNQVQTQGRTINLTGSPVFLVPDLATSVETVTEAFATLALSPNPVKQGQTSLTISLRQATPVSVCLFQSNGAFVNTILHKQQLNTGTHQLTLDTRILATGVYFCQVSTEQKKETIRLVVTH